MLKNKEGEIFFCLKNHEGLRIVSNCENSLSTSSNLTIVNMRMTSIWY